MLFVLRSILVLALALSALESPLRAGPNACVVETVAGGRPANYFDGRPATEAQLLLALDFDLGPDGSLYVADPSAHAVFRVRPGGVIETAAGSGRRASTGDGGLATEAELSHPAGVRVAPEGTVYIREGGDRIRRIRLDGVIETVLAPGPGQYGIGETVEQTGVHGVSSFDVGPDGSLYLASDGLHRIYRLRTDGSIAVIAGSGDPVPDTGASSGDGGPAVEAELDRPSRIAVGPDGTVYFSDARDQRIRRIRPDGVIETYMTRTAATAAEIGRLRTETGFTLRSALQVDGEGRLYWIDSGANGREVKRIGLDDRVESVWQAGGAVLGEQLLVAASGVYVGNNVQVLRVGAEAGSAEAIAGVESPTFGDGGPALEAALPSLTALAAGSDALYLGAADYLRRVRDGVIDHYAGLGRPSAEVQFGRLDAVAAGPDGSVYVAHNRGNSVIHRIRPDGSAEPFAGNGGSCNNPGGPGSGGRCGDGAPATQAPIGPIDEVAVDGFGNVYLLPSDAERRDADGIRIVLGDGTIGTLRGEMAPGARWADVSSLTVENGENLIAYSRSLGKLWRIDAQREAQEIPVPAALLSAPLSLVGAGPGDHIYLLDFQGLHRLAPDGSSALLLRQDRRFPTAGDGGPPDQATVGVIAAAAASPEGDLFVADSLNRRVRRLRAPSACPGSPSSIVATVNGGFTAGLAPGSLVSLFGAGLGPVGGVAAGLDANGRFPVEFGGVALTVNGRPAPLLYASDGQLNAVLPTATKVVGRYRSRTAGSEPYFDAGDHRADLRLFRNGSPAADFAVIAQPAAPAILPLPGNQAAALNQDGTVNSETNPARRGEIVSLFATGLGATNPPSEDGAPAGAVLPLVIAPVRVWIDQREVEPLYAGGAPGLVTGVTQINFRIPDDVAAGPQGLGLRAGPLLGVIGPRIHVSE